MDRTTGCGLIGAQIILLLLCWGLYLMASVAGPSPVTATLLTLMGLLALGIAAAAFALRGEWSPGTLHKPYRGKSAPPPEPWSATVVSCWATAFVLAVAGGGLMVAAHPWTSLLENRPLAGMVSLGLALGAAAWACRSSYVRRREARAEQPLPRRRPPRR